MHRIMFRKTLELCEKSYLPPKMKLWKTSVYSASLTFFTRTCLGGAEFTVIYFATIEKNQKEDQILKLG